MDDELPKNITKSALLVRAVLVSSLLAISLLTSSLFLNELDSIMMGLLTLALVANTAVLGISVYVLFHYSYKPFSTVIKTLTRYYFYGTLLSWFVWMPLLIGLGGLGVGEFFFLLSGVLLYVAPAWLIMSFEHVKWWSSLPRFPHKVDAKSWHVWMKEQPFNSDANGSIEHKSDERK